MKRGLFQIFAGTHSKAAFGDINMVVQIGCMEGNFDVTY